MHVYCQTDDGSRLEVSQGDGTADQGDRSEYITMRTSNGRMVNISLKDGRELAGWLIEHCTEDPDGDHGDGPFGPGNPPPETDPAVCTIRECSGYGTVHH